MKKYFQNIWSELGKPTWLLVGMAAVAGSWVERLSGPEVMSTHDFVCGVILCSALALEWVVGGIKLFFGKP